MSFATETILSLSEVKTTTATKRCSLGTRGTTGDGRKWVYAKAGSALTIGIPAQTAKQDGLATGNTLNMTTEDITSTWRTIRMSATASTWTEPCQKDDYADGFLVVEASTQSLTAGQMVIIKSNTLANDSVVSSTSGSGLYYTDITFADDDCLKKGLDTDGTFAIHHNPCWNVVPFAGVGTLVGSIVGVTACAVPTAAPYCWLCTWGPAVVLTEGTTVLGNVIIGTTGDTDANAAVGCCELATMSTGDTFTFPTRTSLTRPTIGYQFGPSPGDAEYGLMFLTISP